MGNAESKMNTKVLLTLVVLMTSFYGFSQRGVRIGYVDMEYILENVEEYRDATKQLNDKAQKWKQEIELKQSVVEQMKKRFDGGKSALDRRTDFGEGRRDTVIGKGNVGLSTRPFWTSRGFGATETIVDTADTGSGFQ